MRTTMTIKETDKEGMLPEAIQPSLSLSSVWHKSYNQFNDKTKGTRGGLS
jgi:hypothetical protein